MEVSISSSPMMSSTIRQSFSGIRVPGHAKPFVNGICKSRSDRLNGKAKSKWRITAMDGVLAPADPGQAEVTWQTVVGAIAGVTPFVIAGIEFSKRIIAQRKCEVCGGSGLVLRDKYYFRCPGCGGFLPWQSWKRFFSVCERFAHQSFSDSDAATKKNR